MAATDQTSAGAGERPGQLRAAADVELAVRVAEVPLDGLDGDEQGVGDLPVALAGGGELGDAALAGSEPVGGMVAGAGARPPASRSSSRALLGEGAGPDGLGERERLTQRVARLRGPPGAADRRAEIDQRAGLLDPDAGRGEQLDGRAQQLDRGFAAREQPGGTPGDPDRPGGAEALGER